jgi:hypothetical protein
VTHKIDPSTLHINHRVRCYDGVFDSATRRVQAAHDRAIALIQTRHRHAHVTFFPMEGLYQTHHWGVPLSAFHPTQGQALEDALRRLDLLKETP